MNKNYLYFSTTMTKTIENLDYYSLNDYIKFNEKIILLNNTLPILYNVPMSLHTTFKIGGPANALITVKTSDELINTIKNVRTLKIPYFILGGGSNILVSDFGIKGIVIKNETTYIKQIEYNLFKYLDLKSIDLNNDVFLLIGSGTKISEIVKYACDNSLTGCEFLAGIPGTLGGAIYGNAGAYGKAISDILILTNILDQNNNIISAKNDYFQFKYRHSILKQTNEIVISAVLKLKKGDTNKIKDEVNKIINERKLKHPPENIGSAGSYFKNIEPTIPNTKRLAAGYFLELVGAKNMYFQNAKVYEKHANFIINPGGATAFDVLNLALKLKEKVLKKFGILLSEEVIYIK